VAFGSSSALAAAYGIAVTVTMFITTLLTFFVVRHGWAAAAGGVGATGVFLAVDACWSRLLAQVLAGRLVPAGRRAAHLHADGDLEARPRAADREHPQRRPRAAALHHGARRDEHPAHARTAVYAVANPAPCRRR
jgi:KUP system potassium uptake protein